MNKRKAIVCTALLTVIMFALYFASVFIENSNGVTLYEFRRLVSFPWLCGRYVGKLTIRFFKWLIKDTEEQNKINKGEV